MTVPASHSGLRRRVSRLRLAVSVLLLLVLGYVLFLFNSGGLRTFQVISRSMEPALAVGDYVLMKRVGRDQPLRGAIVTVENPQVNGELLAKRVIAADGDEVQLRDGMIFINGRRETANRPRIEHVPDQTWKVAPGEVFVVGDNRNDSLDSVDFGPLPIDRVHGILVYRYWPPNRAGRLQ
ncbi:MAG: signal peptidase I [Candidatus Sumerlaeaceae bacterium]|nr:signal peptidase I [Candidatus Sumerlaeaceae bacterium]